MSYPIKLSFKTEIIPLLILAAAFAFGWYFYGNFPEQVATHWNFAGQPDDYSGRFAGAFGIPLVMLAMYVLFLLLPMIDPKRERYAEFSRVYHVFRAMIMAVLLVVFLSAGYFNLGYNVNISRIVPITVGALFILMGNYMGKIKSNWFVGVRTPWALSSEENWGKSQRFGGKMFMLCGLFIIISPFLGQTLGMVVFFAGVAAAVLGSTIYSYWLSRK